MGKINFLNDNQNSSGAGDQSDNKKVVGESEIKWTSPEPIIYKDNENTESEIVALDTIQRIKNRLSFVDEKNNQTGKPLVRGDDFSIKKSESEIGPNKFSENKKNFGFLKNIFGPKKSNNEFKNRKEIIADYGNVVNDEKNLRKNNNNFQDYENENKAPLNTGSIKSSAITNKWKASKILKTDLIKDEVTIFVDWKKNIKNLLSNLFMALIIIAIAYFGLELWGEKSAQQIKTLDNEVQDLVRKINKLGDEMKEIDNFQKQLSMTGKVIDQHVYWTNFFNFLEKNTLPEIIFNGGFSGNLLGTYKFSAYAPSFTSLVNQARVFEADTTNVLAVEVSKGVLSDAPQTSQSANKNTNLAHIKFDMSLVINPKIFSK